ncbi:MAG: VOC family protein [Gammaproteobacteria bacterium]|nr:VOC family protein [Gammaproteobacteria bacterium]
MIRAREIDHLVLRTVHPEALVVFYCDVLGMVVERRVESAGLVQLRAGRSLLDVVTGEPGVGRNLDHFCLRIEPFDEAAIRAHLERHGVAAGPTEMRYGAEGSGPSIYIEDPDGNVVELKGPPA